MRQRSSGVDAKGGQGKMTLRLYTLLISAFLGSSVQAQTQPKVDLGLILCWNNETDGRLAHDQRLLQAVGRALALQRTAKTIGVRADSCTTTMPGDAACFSAPKVVICQIAVIQRVIRAAAWITSKQGASASLSYEQFRRANPESTGHAFQYADYAQTASDADSLLDGSSSANLEQQRRMALLTDYSLATLLGHEITHADDNNCPISAKSSAEESGLLAKIIQDDLTGEIFGKHSPAPEELAADRCALRHIRALNQRLTQKFNNEDVATLDFFIRASADMVVFQSCFGWRKYRQLPDGKYVIYSLDSYLYAPYRGLLFASEIRGSFPKPVVCGYAADMLVQAIQTTYRNASGRGNVDNSILAYFPKGVEASWNGAPWTAGSFACSAAPN
jgi:hypothetical protein